MGSSGLFADFENLLRLCSHPLALIYWSDQKNTDSDDTDSDDIDNGDTVSDDTDGNDCKYKF